jgi:predicted deacetylase
MQTTPPFSFQGHSLCQGTGNGNGKEGRSLVVSIHDLSSVTRGTVTRMLEDLSEVGVPVTSLLVIPDHHQCGRIDQDPGFGPWLRQKVKEGHEAVLHGFYHLRRAKPHESAATKLITRSYTAGEGEFYDLSHEEASILLKQGRESLRNCHLPPSDPEGFIAPAWLLGSEAERAVRDEGFDYTTRIGSVIDCQTGCHYSSRSMVYSVRAAWRRGMSLLWNEALFHALRETPLLRIGLHPPDWEHRRIRHHALKSLRLAATERNVTTYGKWLARARSSGHEGKRSF